MSEKLVRIPTPRPIHATVGRRLGNAARDTLRRALDAKIACVIQDGYGPHAASERRYRFTVGEYRTRSGLGKVETQAFLWLHYARYRTILAFRPIDNGRPLSVVVGRKVAKWWAIATATRDHIVERNLALTVPVVNKYCGNSDRDDASQVAILKLISSMDTFDPMRGIRFSTYATTACIRAVLQHREKEARAVRMAGGGGVNGLLSDARDIDDIANDQELIDSAFSGGGAVLEPCEQAVLVCRFGLGKPGKAQTLRETGQALSLSIGKVSEIQSLALAKLREVAGEG